MTTTTQTGRVGWLLILMVLALTALLANPRTANPPATAASDRMPRAVAELETQAIIDLGW